MAETVELDARSEANDRACAIVLNSIGKRPQDAYAKYLIMEKMLASYNPDHKGTVVSIKELSEIDPNPDQMAEKVNAIHTNFGIPRQVTGQEAVSMICDFAMGSLEGLKYLSRVTAEKLGKDFPDDLKQGRIEEPIKGEKFFSPAWINRARAARLESYLLENTDVREAVETQVKEWADEARAGIKSQHHDAAHGNSEIGLIK